MLVIGVPYEVLRGNNDGTLHPGDKVCMWVSGHIRISNASGFLLEPPNQTTMLAGAVLVADMEWVEARREDLLTELAKLEGL